MLTPEERKIALEEKWFELKKEIFLSKQKENKPAPPRKIIDPVIATIVVAIIGFIATTIGTIINNANAHQLEQRKFESELIKKSIEQPTREDIIKSLRLLTTLKLLHDDDVKNALDSFLVDTTAAKEALPGFETVPVSKIGRDSLFQLYVVEFGNLKDKQRIALSNIFDFIKADTSIKDVRYVAYILATIKWETANTFIPVAELGSDERLEMLYGKETKTGKVFENMNDGDGAKYKGRGYIQLTGYKNYKFFNTLLKLENTSNDIVQNPGKALDPVISYRVISYSMITGYFTGKKLSQYIDETKTDYVGARKLINGLDHAELIAGFANKFEQILRKSLSIDNSNSKR